MTKKLIELIKIIFVVLGVLKTKFNLKKLFKWKVTQSLLMNKILQ